MPNAFAAFTRPAYLDTPLATPMPANEAHWGKLLAKYGDLKKPKQTVAEKTEGLLSKVIGTHLAKRTMGPLNDLTPVGNAIGVDEGQRNFRQGVSRGDLRQAALGAGIFGLSLLPFASKAKRPLGALLKDEAGAIRYHGTNEIFDQFDPAKSNGLYFFSDSPDIARIYGHRVKAADINFRNPMTVPQVADPAHIPRLADDARAAGHDGLIIESINDVGGPQRQFVAFDPPKLVNAPSNDATDAHSLAGLLTDPRPTHELYQTGDVLLLGGDAAHVVGVQGNSLVVQTPQGRRIVARNDPNLSVAPPSMW